MYRAFLGHTIDAWIIVTHKHNIIFESILIYFIKGMLAFLG